MNGRSRLFAVAWLVIATALCIAVVTWVVSVGRALGPIAQDARPVLAPYSTAAPTIVTDYTQDGSATPQSLCAELSPVPGSVIVESQTGTMISTVQCPQK